MAEDIEGTPVEEDGQGAATPEGQGQPFFEVDYDGKHLSFNDPDELKKTFNESVMMQNRFTQKTQELADMRKAFEQQQAEFKDYEKRTREDLKQFDNFVSNRPDLYQKLKDEISRPAGPDVAYQRAVQHADEKLSETEKRLADFEQWRAELESEKEKQAAISELRAKYPDLDERSLDEIMNRMASGGVMGILETAYLAHKGSMDPAKLQERIAKAQAEQQNSRVLNGKSSTPAQSKEYKSIDEAVEALKNSDLNL